MANNINVLMGGKFGDFLHSLVFADYAHKFKSTKVNLFIGDVNDPADGFWNGPENTRQDLYPTIIQQPYINSFELYTSEQRIDVNLSTFRYSKYIDKCAWTDLYLKTYTDIQERLHDNRVITAVDSIDEYKDIVVIHQRPERESMEAYPLYESLLKTHDCIFLTQIDEWYDVFPLKDKVRKVTPTSGTEMFNILSSCKYYIGNQTGVTAAAHMLNVPRMVICRDTDYHTLQGKGIKLNDQMHYTAEVQYYSNMSYFINEVDFHISPNSILHSALLAN